jgi:hypothetical protein
MVVAATVARVAAQTRASIILGTPSATVNSDNWALSGPNMVGLRTALTNPSNFGPTGTVDQQIILSYLNAPTSAALAGVDVFLAPYWNDVQSTPFVAGIVAAFNSGMHLILLEDDASHDAIGSALGLPTINSTAANSSALGGFVTGPFGTPAPNSIQQTGATGAKIEASVLALGGTVAAKNLASQVTAAYWAPGTFGGNPNAGALFIFGDVDMTSDYGSVSYPPTIDDNGIFTLNAFASVVGSAAPPQSNAEVPEPSQIIVWSGLTTLAGACAYLRRARLARASAPAV